MARGKAAVGDGTQLRVLGPAARHGVGAAVCECAMVWRTDRVGHDALDALQLPVRVGERRRAAQQGIGIGVQRRGEEIADRRVLDELGYVPLSQSGSELLFDVFSRRYENGATIVTSNLPFQEWTTVFASERLTGALLDRITHHVHILSTKGT